MSLDEEIDAEQAAERAKHLCPFDPLDPTIADTLWERSAEIRDSQPVSWMDGQDGAWHVTRYEDVFAAASNWQKFTTRFGAGPAQYDLDVYRMTPLETDPPVHRYIRRVLTPFFTPAATNAREPMVRAAVEETMAHCKQLGEADFMKEFAIRLPSKVFTGFVLPDASPERVEWIHDIIHDLFVDPTLIVERAPQLLEYCEELLEQRRAAGKRDDVIGAIAHMGFDDECPLEERARRETVYLLIQAGMETTAGGLGHVCQHLAENPDVRARLRDASPEVLDRAVDEYLRFQPPVPAAARTATEDLSMGGCPIRAGDRVLLNWASASRDPEVFPNPEEFDLERDNAGRHLSFGAGIHRCLGSHLAIKEIRLAIEAICELDVFERVPGTKVHFRPAMSRGADSLMIRCA